MRDYADTNTATRLDPREPAPRADVHRRRSRAAARVTARRSRTRSSASPTVKRHQIFLEPEGATTLTYLSATASPRASRRRPGGVIPTIPGLEHAEIMRFGLRRRVRLRRHPRSSLADARDEGGRRALLRRADQRHDRLRGGRRTGPHRRDQRRPRGRWTGTAVLDRSQAYIGVLVDDLVTRA